MAGGVSSESLLGRRRDPEPTQLLPFHRWSAATLQSVEGGTWEHTDGAAEMKGLKPK